jgi:3-methyladenine DNA glycosylase/8-oxoguanine DNA glycosylase
MPATATTSSASDASAVGAIRRNLGWYQHGRRDPTTRLGPMGMLRATHTVDGPATVALDWSRGQLDIDAWGPGAERARIAARAMTALDRPAPPALVGHPMIREAARRHPTLTAGSSGDLFHALLPTIIGQRITAREAFAQWGRLVYQLGERAPGPVEELMLPPHPDRLAEMPAWWFHPLGIEMKRARPLIAVARLAARLWEWAPLPYAEVAAKLTLVPGIGPWTIGSVMGPVCGDDDAVPIGDFHFPSMVAWNLAGEARGDDARMLELLEPYRPQRGRVLRLIGLCGRRVPARGPRRRVLPMYRW